MSATVYSSSALDAPNNSSFSEAKKSPLALPETAHNAAESQIITLDMSNGNTSVKLDHLGPMVVGVDGTLARVSNWEEMTANEQKATLRIIGKRNKDRLEALKTKDKEA